MIHLTRVDDPVDPDDDDDQQPDDDATGEGDDAAGDDADDAAPGSVIEQEVGTRRNTFSHAARRRGR